ncbi:hypothetical protein CALCODRAFT_504687 [Calocera cornea HHB12733]|uniref:FZ domain-containing protein n=1 Tax=Calocera cornea HHB12733 TaxID=1353952 RepID=A0A165CA55_9BASI|nr:hypothetical protein CALCODRAFT_504687 [Calocera cornea HHB12733]
MFPTSLLALLAILLQPSSAQDAPAVGDTTQSLALVFSPPFLPPEVTPQTYPNYTLPPVQPSWQPPADSYNYTLFVFPTTEDTPTSANDTSSQGLRAVNGVVQLASNATDSSLVLRDPIEGWRRQWLVGGLNASTNYTVFTVEDRSQVVTGPVYLLTKNVSFPCTLVHSLPYCPFVSYAVPIPPPSQTDPSQLGTSLTQQTYAADDLPGEYTAILLSSLGNFSITLSSFACGRDVYSPLKTCEDCYDAYRDWACAISFPRCANTDVSALPRAPLPAPALMPRTNMSRNTFPPLDQTYTELLPCIETCTMVDRSCPYFLQFGCPLPGVTAEFSYGVGFIDDAVHGRQGKGVPGAAEEYGYAWCNAGSSYDY